MRAVGKYRDIVGLANDGTFARRCQGRGVVDAECCFVAIEHDEMSCLSGARRASTGWWPVCSGADESRAFRASIATDVSLPLDVV